MRDGGFNALKVTAEQHFRGITFKGDATDSNLKRLLEELRSLPGHPEFFKYSMPEAAQKAHDDAAAASNMKFTDLREEAGRLCLDMTGVKADVLKRVLVNCWGTNNNCVTSPAVFCSLIECTLTRTGCTQARRSAGAASRGARGWLL